MSNVLLVIDDVPEICHIFQRALRSSFDVVHTATCTRDAIRLLAAEPITHVICDLFLGGGEQLGCEFMMTWRKQKPSIRYVALLTGTNLEGDFSYEGIDAVFHKPDGVKKLIETFG